MGLEKCFSSVTNGRRKYKSFKYNYINLTLHEIQIIWISSIFIYLQILAVNPDLYTVLIQYINSRVCLVLWLQTVLCNLFIILIGQYVDEILTIVNRFQMYFFAHFCIFVGCWVYLFLAQLSLHLGTALTTFRLFQHCEWQNQKLILYMTPSNIELQEV